MTSAASCIAGVLAAFWNVAVVDRYCYVRLLGLSSPFNRVLLGYFIFSTELSYLGRVRKIAKSDS